MQVRNVLAAAAMAFMSGAAAAPAAAQALRGRRQAAADHDPDRLDAVVPGVREGRRALRGADRQQDQARRHAVRRHAREGAQRGARRAEPLRLDDARHAVDDRVLRRRLPGAAEGDRPRFDLPKEVLSLRRLGLLERAEALAHADGGKLMAYTPLGNVQVLYYRADLLKQAGIAPPKTWDDVLAACKKLHRAARHVRLRRCAASAATDPLRLDDRACSAEGGAVVKDPQDGDYTVTINSPQAQGGARPVHRRC